jgi:hypothetical protein
MKLKKPKISSKVVNALLLKLEGARSAILKHNFNLAEVLVSEYFQSIPQDFVDKKVAKFFLDALRDRNGELLLACIDAEVERLSLFKIKLLRELLDFNVCS